MRSRATLLLVAATAAWGSTFVIVQDAIAHTSVVSFLAWRFLLAGGLLAVIRPGRLRRLGRQGWARGFLLGLALAGGYLLQTYGLLYTTAAVSGFLTGLQVVLTPLLAWAVFRRRPHGLAIVATVVAAGGIGVMTMHSFSIGRGELLTLGCAAMFAVQIVGLSRWSTSGEAYGLAAVQLLTVAGCCLVVELAEGGSVPSGTAVWQAIAVTAVLATAVAFVVQSWAQSKLSPARTAVVLTMEPVFAALTSAAVGQAIGWHVIAGGALVVGAMFLVDAPGGRRLRLDSVTALPVIVEPPEGVGALEGGCATSATEAGPLEQVACLNASSGGGSFPPQP
jgi:drug/metabolite transporter (DMT)-like permease